MASQRNPAEIFEDSDLLTRRGDVCGPGKELIVRIGTGGVAWNFNFGTTMVPHRQKGVYLTKGNVVFLVEAAFSESLKNSAHRYRSLVE